MPTLEVGVDEFTLVLLPTGKIDVMDWLDELDKMMATFIRLSRIEELYGPLGTATKKLQAGYTSGLTVQNRPWHFMICWHEDIPTMGLCIKFSAHAYAAYRQDFQEKYQAKMNIVEFLKMVDSDIYVTRLSRIDLTADYKDYPNPRDPNGQLDPDTLYRQLINGNYVIKNQNGKKTLRTLSALHKNGVYETFYAGSRKGKTDGFLRCYDKKTEQIVTKGFRYDEAIQCKSWVRFEAVFKGTYAHQITEQLKQISTEDELTKLIAKHISDKYQLVDVATGDTLDITEDLAQIALGSGAGTLISPSNRDNTIRQSIQYLKKNSGLFAVFFKVSEVWGAQGERKLFSHLREIYQSEYKPTAGEKPEMKDWYAKHYRELRGQRLEDNFM